MRYGIPAGCNRPGTPYSSIRGTTRWVIVGVMVRFWYKKFNAGNKKTRFFSFFCLFLSVLAITKSLKYSILT